MKSITNTQAPAIIEDIVRAHHLPGRFRADTANNSLSTILCTIDEVDAEARKVLFTVRKRGLRTLTRQRSIRTGKDGEYFTFAGHTFHAWQFQTWEEHADIMDDFFTHYRIIDSHVPNVRQSQGRGGSPMFEDALVMSGLPYGDNVDASGFVQHIKLPHYVDFQADLSLIRGLRAKRRNKDNDHATD